MSKQRNNMQRSTKQIERAAAIREYQLLHALARTSAYSSFYDRLVAMGSFSPGIEVLNVNNVEDYTFEHKLLFDAWKDFPCIEPQFDAMFIECNRPKQDLYLKAGISAYGALLSRVEANERNVRLIKSDLAEMYGRIQGVDGVRSFVNDVINSQLKAGCTTYVLAMVFTQIGTQIAQGFTHLIPLDERGAYVKGLSLNFGINPSAFGFHNNEVTPSEVGGKADLLDTFPYTMLCTLLMGVSFLHCKNVRTSEHVPSAEQFKHFEKRFRVPMVTYKTLRIVGVGEAESDTDSQTTSSNIQRSMHIVRGHFSTYTEDRPLFGKYAGTFWIPAHIRGNQDKGIVTKDYEATP